MNACLHESHSHTTHLACNYNCNYSNSNCNSDTNSKSTAINAVNNVTDKNLIDLNSNATYQRIITESETVIKTFFSTLSVVCVVNNKFFCVAGGPASQFRFLHELNACKTRVAKDDGNGNDNNTTSAAAAAAIDDKINVKTN